MAIVCEQNKNISAGFLITKTKLSYGPVEEMAFKISQSRGNIPEVEHISAAAIFPRVFSNEITEGSLTH